MILLASQKNYNFIDFPQIPETVMNHLKKLEPQLRIELSDLINMLKTLADIVTDTDFVKQSLEMNNVIAVLSADN